MLDFRGFAAQRPPLLRPIPTLATPQVRLLLTSATLLFVELFLIRWIPANVIYVGFFSNFLLMGSFLGIGVGILLGRNGLRLPTFAFPLLLFAVVRLVSIAQLNVQLDSPDQIYFGLADEAHVADVNFLVLPLVVLLTTAVMASLAVPLGPLLRAMPPLRAYGIDIVGSMIGIAGFAILSALGTPPPVWLLVVTVLTVALVLGTGFTAWSSVGFAALAACIFVTLAGGDRWSPYQRIRVHNTLDSIALSVNGVPHQGFYSDPKHELYEFYTQIDRWFPGKTYDRVLIIGAGTGNDTAAAIERGVEHVDAVEIDPVIQQLGAELHPRRPYQDPRVSAHVDDGRAFLRNSSDKYDLVVFALPDSLTLVSTTADVRLESFLFTKQAFESVRDHLAPGGTFVLYNFYRQPWLLEKITSMLESTFGYPPVVKVYGQLTGTAAVLATGPAIGALNGAPPPGDVTTPVSTGNAPRPATDDWPFLYLREPGVAPHYVGALALIMLFALVLVVGAARVSGTSIRRFSPHFFVLGVAFLLLETRSLVTFSLLFGNTWIVNAFVFFAILASVLAAIGVNARFRIRDPRPLYVVLFGLLALAWILPPASLLIEPAWLRYTLASALAFAPVFLANLVFSYSFRDSRTADMAFASNLLGAMAGGVLEYVALLSGYQTLLVVVAGLYAGAYVLSRHRRFMGDRELVDERDTDPKAPEFALA